MKKARRGGSGGDHENSPRAVEAMSAWPEARHSQTVLADSPRVMSVALSTESCTAISAEQLRITATSGDAIVMSPLSAPGFYRVLARDDPQLAQTYRVFVIAFVIISDWSVIISDRSKSP
jgi:hypothetical protein